MWQNSHIARDQTNLDYRKGIGIIYDSYQFLIKGTGYFQNSIPMGPCNCRFGHISSGYGKNRVRII